MDASNNLDQIVIARRLLLYSKLAEAKRKGKKVDEKSIKAELDKDTALISGNAPAGNISGQNTQPIKENVQISLPDISARLKELDGRQADNSPTQVQVNIQKTVEIKANIQYTVLEKVEGLVRRSQTLAETDRYSFDFSEGSTFKITDKWSGRSTTIWGDPHVDVDDVAGNQDGDFQDLQASNSHTTMMLQDGSRVTFTAQDNGLIEVVDIFKGNQHLEGIGKASAQWSDEKGLFTSQVDQNAGKSSALPMGDSVYAGGDGNDWFTTDGKLLWGKTTGPAVSSRPYAVMQLDYQEKTSQEVRVQVNQQA